MTFYFIVNANGWSTVKLEHQNGGGTEIKETSNRERVEGREIPHET